MASLLDLFVKIGAKDEASGTIEKVANGAKTAFKAIGVAVGAAATAVGALTKSAVSAYADYEQLVGGVETLFGAGGKSLEEYAASVGQTTEEASAQYDALMQAQQMMLANASKAYETAGLSANDYMETVTGFSAALVSSLAGDTVKAAEYADMALVDMADNANKMGTDMESIQNAYQGFAKQNYTMLDNLKLGYGGTKSEMERLLDTANEINAQQGIITDYQIENYADIVDAIHVVQTQMGITGTTAKEAAETISGSASAMKSAWQNLITGLADENADMDLLVSQFSETVETLFSNVGPRVEAVLSSIGRVVERELPNIANKIPKIISKYLPRVLSVGGQLVTSIANGIFSSKDELIDSALDVVTSFAQFVLDALPELPGAAFEIITSLADGITEAIPELLPAAIDAVTEFALKLTDPGSLNEVIHAGLGIIKALAESLFSEESISELIEAVPEIIAGLASGFVTFVTDIVEIARLIIDNIKNAFADEETRQKMIEGAGEILLSLSLAIGEMASELLQLGVDIMTAIWDGMKRVTGDISMWLTETIQRWLGITPIHGTGGGAIFSMLKEDYGIDLTPPEESPPTPEYNPSAIGNGTGGMKGNTSVVITQNIYADGNTAADYMEEAFYQAEKSRWLGG